MIQKIIDLLGQGCIDEASELLGNEIKLPEEIERWGYDTNNIVLYTLVCKMLIENESAGKHRIASYLLAMPLCIYKDAYSLALYHAKRALALDPEDVSNKIFLLFFHNIPEQLIEKDEAVKIAHAVLQKEPDCVIAQNILKKYNIAFKI